MSWSRFLQQRKSKAVWWAALLLVGTAVLLLMWPWPNLDFPSTELALTPTANPQNAASGAQGQAGEKEYLAEYNPDTVTLLDAAPNEEEQSLTWQFGQMIFKLAVVLGLVYLVLHGLKWLQRNKPKGLPHAGGATINILETTGLAPGRFLHLVVVGEKTLLLGATDHQITLLAELQDAAIPLTEEDMAFAEALNRHKQPPEPAAIPPRPAAAPPPAPTPAQTPTPAPAYIKPAPQPMAVSGLPVDNMLENMLDEKVPAAEYTPDWQSALSNLRTGIRNIQESVGG
jgi:flagellar biogenesis protein FliO